MNILEACGAALLLLVVASAGGETETEVTSSLAEKYDARTEVVLRDGSRVDLLNKTHAIEADWAHKWAEGIGQSIHYSLITGKKPGLLILTRNPEKDWRHLVRAARVCGHLGIELYIEERSVIPPSEQSEQ